MRWFWQKEQEEEKKKAFPIIQASLHDVKKAIRNFEKELPKGVARSVLVQRNNEINMELLAPYLNGIPDDKFYMSKETYEVFEEDEQHIPYYLDMVQDAVDRYVKDHQQFPVIPQHPMKKVSLHLLEKHSYLTERPPLDFYLTDEEYLITHQTPD